MDLLAYGCIALLRREAGGQLEPPRLSGCSHVVSPVSSILWDNTQLDQTLLTIIHAKRIIHSVTRCHAITTWTGENRMQTVNDPQFTWPQFTELAKAMYRKSRRNRNVPIDEHAADDIAQEAWLKMLEHGFTNDALVTFRACVSYAIKEHDAQDQRFPQRCNPETIDETLRHNALSLTIDDESQAFEQLLAHIENVAGEDDKLFAACLALTDTFTQACQLWRIDRKQGYRIRDRILSRLGV